MQIWRCVMQLWQHTCFTQALEAAARTGRRLGLGRLAGPAALAAAVALRLPLLLPVGRLFLLLLFPLGVALGAAAVRALVIIGQQPSLYRTSAASQPDAVQSKIQRGELLRGSQFPVCQQHQ